MKKSVLVFLIVLGFVVGYWLAKENRKLFELPASMELPQNNVQQQIDMGRIAVGMETWQVKQVLGVPEKMNVVIETQNTRKEQWIYGNKYLYFTNGVLTSWQEGGKE
ncbi:MAG: hypothetical protein JRJ42_01995 [Deltaproteobacteria bacterium]|mgnify:CR=1 FL=1|nr:hypothetical protein [Deltaproteobacteria bacterium]MBW2018882.1 hypothetical protein [Deltaproteobacteria bacterium]MBW2073637.1 hypothetical protein [Deltaproteobacteria bacterium]RLB81946.1 MAG: hypothetical protein DRH17_07565 [Deltaproteobacteria bacterium]